MQLKILSKMNGEFFDRDFTCDGNDFSPALEWSELPENAKSLILIMDDPDAPMGTFVHWVIYNLDPTSSGLPENLPKIESKENTFTQGINDFRRVGYGGPCPPRGNPHRYYFHLYATHIERDLKPGLKKKDLMKMIEHHEIEHAEVILKYGRA